jgi:hypothetical protein
MSLVEGDHELISNRPEVPTTLIIISSCATAFGVVGA